MPDAKTREKEIVRITIIGSIVNAVLVVAKFIAGIVGHSSAMIADAVHSLSDFLTDFVVIIMLKISSKPIDDDHKYGHGKFETLATTIIGLLLIFVGFGILYGGAEKVYGVLVHGKTLVAPSWLAFWVAIISVISKEGIYQYTVVKGKHLNSEAMIANAWHHRSDALSSIGTSIGIGAACLLGDKWAILDPIAAIIVSYFILKIAIQLIKTSVSQLLEKSLPKQDEDKIEQIISSCEGVSQMHHLRTRQIGSNHVISMHVRMDGSMSLMESHDKATEIEHKIRESFGKDTIINIHVEPLK